MSELQFPAANISKIYPHELFEALRREMVFDPDPALWEDEDFYAKIQRDPVIEGLIRFRCQLVAGPNWICEPATDSRVDRQAAAVMTVLLKKIKRFRSSRCNLAMSFLKGSTWGKFDAAFDQVAIPGFGRERWYVITRIRDIDKRRFDRKIIREIDPETNERTTRYAWQLAVGVEEGGPIWKDINRPAFIRNLHFDTERSLDWGLGISAALYFAQWFKTEALTRGMSFLERWSEGLIVYSLDALAHAAVGETAAVRAQNALDTIAKVRSGHSIVVPNVDEVKIHDAPKGGWDTAEKAITYMDNAISRLILGAVLPTGGGSATVGSLARAEEEANSTQQIVQFDRDLLAEAITEQVIRLLWDTNRPMLVSLGLGQANMPAFSIQAEKVRDPKERAEVLAAALQAAPALASRIKVSELFEQLGFSPATDDEELETLADLAARAGGALPMEREDA